MRAFATRARTAPLLIALALAAAAPAAAAPAPGKPAAAKPFERRLHVSEVGASSFLSNDSNKFLENHHPNYVADDDPTTAWVEGAKSSGKGEWLRFSLGLRNEISRVRLRVRNGCQKSKDVWKANARAKEVTVRIRGAEKDLEKKVALTDTDGWQEIVVDMATGPLEAVELAIDSVYEGTRTTDLCISDLQVFATSTERDQPELEKSALADLMRWRSARIAAAKMFAALPAGYPLYPSYDVQQMGQSMYDYLDAGGLLEAAAKDPGFAKEWKDALAAAKAVEKNLGSMTRAQLAPTSQTRLVEVHGTQLSDVYDVASKAGTWPQWDALRLPMLGLVSAMFVDQLRAVDVKTGPTIEQYKQAPKGCDTDVAWVARTQPKEGPSRVVAIAIGRCARVVGRGGPQIATSVEIMIYDPTGKLVLVSGVGRLDGYRWTMEGGKPRLAGGRTMYMNGSIYEVRRHAATPAP
jgi:hypothetical protein